ncbi:MAG: hypothetical protein RBR74_12400 [Ignavibacteriaceae bacterium]|jgi:hypothetical protein|nr:hypothetical protein [Ignavibacteriaceae bacterium]
MATYTVNQSQTTVGGFLRLTSINPIIQNPDTRIPELIQCNGIVHYTRSGTRTVVSDENFQIEAGDLLVVADICATGSSQTIVASPQVSDYAFILPTDNFGTNADNYINRRPETRTILSSSFGDSLEAVLNTIVSGPQITSPIKDIIIVTHAGEGGFLFLKLMNNSAPPDQISYYALQDYLNEQVRPQITSRQIKNDTNIHIRGCNIGKEPRYLDLLKRLFGNNVSVTAPKHLDSFSYLSQGTTIHRYEHLSYCFTVFNKNAFTNKQQVISAFINHLPAFEDIYGNSLTQAQLNSWIPQDIRSNAETLYQCTNPISSSLRVNKKYIHRFDNPLYTFDIELDSEPTANQRIDELKNALRQVDTMQTSHDFPEYHQFGYSSLDEFVDNISWRFTWDNSSDTLHCVGSRHLYQLRIPITDTNNQLFLNAFLGAGEKRYLHHQLIETDTRFFTKI